MTEEERKRMDQSALSWSVGVALVLAGIAGILVSQHVGLLLVNAWILLSVATVIIAEDQLLPALLRWVKARRRRSSKGPDVDSSTPTENRAATADVDQPPPHRHFGPRRQAELVTILVLASLTYLARNFDSLPVHGDGGAQPPVTSLQSGGPTPALDCSQCVSPPKAGEQDKSGDGANLTLHLSPTLEAAVLAHVARDARAADRETWWPPSFFVVFLILVALATVYLLLKGRPKEAAPVGALGLAALVLKDPDHFSHLDPSTFERVFFVFKGVTVVLIILCLMKLAIQLLARWCSGPDSSAVQDSAKNVRKSEHHNADAPLTLVFSAFVLLWSLIAVAFHSDPQSANPKPPGSGAEIPATGVAPPPGKPNSIGKIETLPALSGFLPGEHSLPDGLDSAPAFQQALKGASIQANDVLLLLGSTDCTAIRRTAGLTNKALAQNRADWLRRQLEDRNITKGTRVEAIEQHEDCKASSKLRAVYPVLIRGTAPAE